MVAYNQPTTPTRWRAAFFLLLTCPGGAAGHRLFDTEHGLWRDAFCRDNIMDIATTLC